MKSKLLRMGLSSCLSVKFQNFVNENQLDAQLILRIFRQPVHVSGVYRPIIRRYNHLYTMVGTYYSC